MAGGMLGIGVTGLLAYQRALQTVSHNVTNATTEGYSRQRVELGTQIPLFQGGSYIGTGVLVENVSRVYDSFVVGQVRDYTTSYNHAETYARHAGLIDEMLADPEIGLMPAVEDFFGAVQGVANDPTSVPARQALLTQGETLADRYGYLNQRFNSIRDQVDEQIANNVAEINSLGQSIADINRQIVLASGNGVPNDLLDARDQLLAELSEYISIDAQEQDNGAMNVFIGKGQILVVNFDAREISVTSNQYDISQVEVGLQIGGGNINEISDQINGGYIGGLLDFRSQILDVAQNELGALAIGMADTFNAQHMLGMDLDGNLGQAFFNSPSLQVLPGTGAPSTVTAGLVDSNNLTADEYMLRFDGGNNYTLTNQVTGAVTAINTGGASPYTTPEIDGFSLTLTAGAAVGDTYLVRPTRLGANEIDTLITDPRELAVAAPFRTEKSLANAGGAEISAGVATSVANLPLPVDVTLTYNAAGTEFVVAGAVPPVANIPYVNGGTISFNGLQFTITGSPADTDVFTISNNTNGVGDNRNALLLSGLQTTRNLSGSNASYQEFYSGMVADVGIKTRQAQIIERSQETLLEQAYNARDSLSGVNLDEEAANLVKYQQAYQAVGQVIATANTMFNSLLSVLRG